MLEPPKKLLWRSLGIAENLGEDAASQIFPAVIGNGGSTRVGVAKEPVAAALPNLRKTHGFEKAD